SGRTTCARSAPAAFVITPVTPAISTARIVVRSFIQALISTACAPGSPLGYQHILEHRSGLRTDRCCKTAELVGGGRAECSGLFSASARTVLASFPQDEQNY